MVKDICSKVGLEGKFSNHSLRATCTSRMYANEVPEQIIKEVTGHRSDCVRQYKRTNDELREKASLTLGQPNNKKVKITNKLGKLVDSKPKVELSVEQKEGKCE